MSSPFDLAGRVALVTGGNGGIGLAIVEGLIEAGAKALIVGRNTGKNEAAAAATGAGHFAADVTDEAQCRAAVAEAARLHGRLDILVNNAGTNVRARPEALAEVDWHTVIDTNLTSMHLMCQAAYELLKQGGGKVINIGSMLSIFGVPFSPAYAASKGGVVQYTKVLATAWAVNDIQANAILPGWVDTELTQRAREQVPGLYERVLARVPAGRWGAPRDMAGLAVFLRPRLRLHHRRRHPRRRRLHGDGLIRGDLRSYAGIPLQAAKLPKMAHHGIAAGASRAIRPSSPYS